MKSFPFESKNVGTAQAPVWDRAITAEMERKMNKACWENGVFAWPTDGLKVVPGNGMKVTVKPGGCHIEGARAFEDVDRQFNINQANPTYGRIDIVVARFDLSEAVRTVDIYIKEGTPATSPAKPSLIKQPNYYELQLAEITIPKGTTQLTSSMITDTRADKSVCGIVIPAIPYVERSQEYWDSMKEAAETVKNAVNGALTTEIRTEFDRKVADAENKMKKVFEEAKAAANNPMTTTSYKGNLNELFDAGLYSLSSGTTNNPPGTSSYGALMVLKGDGSTRKGEQTDSIQVFFDRGKDEVWMRNSVDKTNSWTSWKRVGSEVVNNLTSGGSDKALSAEQGKELKRLVDQAFQSASEGKRKIAEALTGKGVTGVSSNSTFQQMADGIKGIKSTKLRNNFQVRKVANFLLYDEPKEYSDFYGTPVVAINLGEEKEPPIFYGYQQEKYPTHMGFTIANCETRKIYVHSGRKRPNAVYFYRGETYVGIGNKVIVLDRDMRKVKELNLEIYNNPSDGKILVGCNGSELFILQEKYGTIELSSFSMTSGSTTVIMPHTSFGGIGEIERGFYTDGKLYLRRNGVMDVIDTVKRQELKSYVHRTNLKFSPQKVHKKPNWNWDIIYKLMDINFGGDKRFASTYMESDANDILVYNSDSLWRTVDVETFGFLRNPETEFTKYIDFGHSIAAYNNKIYVCEKDDRFRSTSCIEFEITGDYI